MIPFWIIKCAVKVTWNREWKALIVGPYDTYKEAGDQAGRMLKNKSRHRRYRDIQVIGPFYVNNQE